MRTRPRLVLSLLALLPAVVALRGRAADAADAPTGFVETTGRAEASPVGDVTIQLELEFTPEQFAFFKRTMPDPRQFLQDFAPERGDHDVADRSAKYDDANRKAVLSMKRRGAVQNKGGGLWETHLRPGTTLDRTEGTTRPIAWFREQGTWTNGVRYRAKYAYALPEGATDANFEKSTAVMSWRLASPASTEAPRVTAELRAHDRVMSTVYKVYGRGGALTSYWLAKTVFRNEGRGVARNLKVRYQVQGYGEWSPWQKFPELVPGQTVVSVYYPILRSEIARLRSSTPTDVMMEWACEDSGGRRIDDSDSRRVVILGINEFVFGNLTKGESFGTWAEAFNNAPLLAAWVSANDPVVKETAAMANRVAGGVGAGTDDASARAVLKACYELLQRNDFTYQHPPALVDKSVSFDVQTVQNVKLPRETIRDRSGTCIDLAILYAAMVNALGLDPLLALIPGHCFPIVRLPSGGFVGVETTGLGGGLRAGSLPFQRVVEIGTSNIDKWKKDGKIYVLDVHELWSRGIVNPEVDDMPADILQRWGISEQGRGSPATPAPGPGPAPGPTPTPGGVDALDALLGTWGGKLTQAKIDDELDLDSMLLGVERNAEGVWRAGVNMEYTYRSPTGTKQVQVRGIYESGKSDGDAVRLPTIKLTRTASDKPGSSSEINGDPLNLRMKADGRIEAEFVGANGFTVSLVRKEGDTPAPAPAADPFAAADGLWGGDYSEPSKISDTLTWTAFIVGLDRAADGSWTAGIRMDLTFKVGGTERKGIVTATMEGGVQGDQLVLTTTKLMRKMVDTGEVSEVGGTTLEVKPVDGHIEGKIGIDGKMRGFTLVPKK